MLRYMNFLAALVVGLGSLLGYAGTSIAKQNPITAIDIALEPDATMIQHAAAVNARLLKVFPKGFALDATHHPHITMLQRYVHTTDLDKVYAAVGKVLANEKAAGWKLKAFKFYYIPSKDIGLAGIVVEPTDDLLKLQQKLIDAVAPFTTKTGTAAAFVTTPRGSRHQPADDRLRRDVRSKSIGQELQSARHRRHRLPGLPEADARRTVC